MWKSLLLLLLVPPSLFGDDLELEVSISKKESVQFEPVVLTVSLRNLSGKPQDIYWAFDPSWQYLKIYVTDSAGDTRHWSTGGGISDGIITPRPLPAKQAILHRILLAPFPDTWMDKPGKYYLRVEFQFSEAGVLGSKPVPIVVKSAEGIDKEALERFRGYPQAKFLANFTTALAIADEFEAVIRQYPKSVYVPWCYYALGRAFQSRKEGAVKSNAINAREQYGVLLEKFPKFPLKAEVEYEMARELFRVEKPDEAVREIEKLIKFEDKNPDAELYLFYEVRRIMATSGDGNQPQVIFRELPPH